MNDYYKVLGVPDSATSDAIKRAFREKAKQYHPDVNRTAGTADRFREVFEAYAFLSDAHKRGAYDQARTAARIRKQTPSADFREWQEQARAEAQEYSRMPYEKFMKSALFEVTFAVNNFWSLYLGGAMTFGSIFMIIVLLPIIPLLALLAVPWLIIGPLFLKMYADDRKKAKKEFG